MRRLLPRCIPVLAARKRLADQRPGTPIPSCLRRVGSWRPLLFASASPVRAMEIARVLPEGVELPAVMASLHEHYHGRGIELSKVGNAWVFPHGERCCGPANG